MAGSTEAKKSKLIFTTSKLIHAQVNSLLDRNMMEKGLFCPNLLSISLVKLVKKTISILRAQAESMSLELCYSGPKHGQIVRVDKIRVQQILFNLISNAIKFSK